MRVVVAEDEALIRMDLSEMLAEAGYEVVGQAATGEAAVELVRRLAPDVIVLDVRMPVMDGLTAAEVIAAEGVAAIVMLTAFSDPELVGRASEAGVSGYVVKPASPSNVIPAVEVAWARFKESQELRGALDRATGELEGRKLIDRAKGRLMSKGMDEEAAHHFLRREAMDRRASMVEVARMLLADALDSSDASEA